VRLPQRVREKFREFGRAGGRKRAARMDAASRRAVASRAAAARWLRRRFGSASFAELGLPGGRFVDAGLADLACGRTTVESLAVSLAAPRLRREGIPLGQVQDHPEERLYLLIRESAGDLAHARYNAVLRQMASFADACGQARRDRAQRAP
jgi:hypothetical protein